MDAVRALSPEQLITPPDTVTVGGKDITVPEGAFSLQFTYLVGGERVDVITVDDVIVTVRKSP
jgi:valyl-tRNA synthetase